MTTDTPSEGPYDPREVLGEFYICIQEWIDGGHQQGHHIFSNRLALCGTLKIWIAHQHPRILRNPWPIEDEMRGQFYYANLSVVHPFNPDWYDFVRECTISRTYLNLKRLEWIKKYAKQARHAKQYGTPEPKKL